MAEPMSSAEARLAVLETAVAALIAQLSHDSLEEVVGLLTYLSGTADAANEVADRKGQEQLDHVRFWADEMLGKVMTSRKPSRPKNISPEEAQKLRYPGRITP